MSEFLRNILRIARADRKTIILPEGDDPRVLEAIKILIEEDAANLILIGDKTGTLSEINSMGVDSSAVSFVNPEACEEIESYTEAFYNLRKHKGMTIDNARKALQDPVYLGLMMLKLNQADGLVAGAAHSTSNIIRPALQIIKPAPGLSVVSSTFFIIKDEQILLFADCGLNENPDPEQLAEITLSTSFTAKLFGLTPRIALLSYSTRGSGRGKDVEKMKKAKELADRRMAAVYQGEYLIDGEIQFDAAFVPAVSEVKCPDSPLKGEANIFIFPDLSSGNIASKIADRMAGADVYGPILQGLARPVNDLSRGCSSGDIVAAVAITAIQAIN